VRIRLTEKRILSESLDFFENRIRDLDRIEFYAERRLKNLGLLDDSGDMTPWDEFNI
jgi:[ribulose-bisphosphate carboxylase]-lysine N-methyltransferase